jgi:hypothetical protein
MPVRRWVLCGRHRDAVHTEAALYQTQCWKPARPGNIWRGNSLTTSTLHNDPSCARTKTLCHYAVFLPIRPASSQPCGMQDVVFAVHARTCSHTVASACGQAQAGEACHAHQADSCEIARDVQILPRACNSPGAARQSECAASVQTATGKTFGLRVWGGGRTGRRWRSSGPGCRCWRCRCQE